MVHIKFEYDDKPTKEFECKECMVYGNITVMKGVTASKAKVVRIPLFKVTQMESFE